MFDYKPRRAFHFYWYHVSKYNMPQIICIEDEYYQVSLNALWVIMKYTQYGTVNT